LRVLSPGETWEGVVELHVQEAVPTRVAVGTLAAGRERREAVPEASASSDRETMLAPG
jgi:hypothetical protein